MLSTTTVRDHPDQPSTLPTSSRTAIQASLSFSSSKLLGSSSSSVKRRVEESRPSTEHDNDNGWSALVKRTKGDKPTMVTTIQEDREKAKDRESLKKEKRAALKAKNKKAKNLMSFS